MNILNFNEFISNLEDLEKKEYEIRSHLAKIREQFSHSKLYPTLSELIELHKSLAELLRAKNNFEKSLPHEIDGLDIEKKLLHFKPLFSTDDQLKKIEKLVSWSLPLIRREIEEGQQIYDFIDNNMHITDVGILPLYKDEGYYFIPDNRHATLNVMRYEVSIYSSSQGAHRALKTSIVKTIKQGALLHSPESIKMEMTRENADLPNPATFLCDTELDFPFAESLLPIAKRKLMMHLAI